MYIKVDEGQETKLDSHSEVGNCVFLLYIYKGLIFIATRKVFPCLCLLRLMEGEFR